MLQSFCPAMLAHLKPKKQTIYNNKCCIMQSYIRTTNWKYRTSSPIHCKKNIQSHQKLNTVTTQNLSIKNQQTNPLRGNKVNIQHRFYENDNKIQKIKQIQNKDSKNMSPNKKIQTIQLSTLYKKKFKYNTTIHQILKNAANNSNCRRSLSYQSQKSSNLGNKVHTNISTDEQRKMMETCNFNIQKPNHIQELKNRNQMFDMSDTNFYCISNNSNNQINTEVPQQLKTSQFKFRVNRPHLTMLNWKKQPKKKRSLQIKSKSNRQNKPFSFQTTNTYQIKKQPIAKQQKKPENIISKDICKPQTRTIAFNSQQPQPIYQKQIRTQRLTKKNQYNYHKIKDTHKISQNIKNTDNIQFVVDAWNTKEKDQFQMNHNFIIK